ncbi:MAG: class GN sortase [Acidobacteriota bacterium]
MKSRGRVIAMALCAALALGCGAGSLWIEAKAVLAQVLLERAWSNTAGARDRIKPWPWADTWPVARLSVPRLGERWIVLAGASGRTLAFGPGHLDGTPLPGERGNVVLAGHRDTQFATLEALQLGDELLVETPARKIARFQVSDLEIIDQRELARVTARGEDGLTLVTCWPFGALVPGGNLRYVVRASPVIDESMHPQRLAIRG